MRVSPLNWPLKSNSGLAVNLLSVETGLIDIVGVPLTFAIVSSVWTMRQKGSPIQCLD